MTEKKRRGRLLPVLCKLLGWAIILLVIAFCLSLFVPKQLGFQTYNILSGSMEPAIPVGSMIYVEDVAPENVAEDDVIVFMQDHDVVAHRVVQNRLVEGEFVTKGDANAAEDFMTVPYGDLMGRVVKCIPKLGDFTMMYTSFVGKVYILLFALCGVLFNILGDRLKRSA